METRADADWCWHCGFSYEEADARSATASTEEPYANEMGAEERNSGTHGRNRNPY
jgi:hypothetical protein